MGRVRGDSLFVQFKAVYETKNSIYMVMEFIDGKPLINLDYPEQYTKSSRFKIMNQLLLALQRLENLKIVHRDIKHDNILLTP